MGCINAKSATPTHEGVVAEKQAGVKKPGFFKRLFRREQAVVLKAPEPEWFPAEQETVVVSELEEEAVDEHRPLDNFQIRRLRSRCRSLCQQRGEMSSVESEVMGMISEPDLSTVMKRPEVQAYLAEEWRQFQLGMSMLEQEEAAWLREVTAARNARTASKEGADTPMTPKPEEESLDEQCSLNNFQIRLLRSRSRSLCGQRGEKANKESEVLNAKSEPDLALEKRKPKVMAKLTRTWQRLREVFQKEREDGAMNQKLAVKTKRAGRKMEHHRASRTGDKKSVNATTLEDQHASIMGGFGEDHWLSDVSLD